MIPGEPSTFQVIWKGIINLIEKYSVYVNNVLMKDQLKGEVNYLTCAFAFGIPLILVIMTIRVAFKEEQRVEDKRVAAEAKKKKQ